MDFRARSVALAQIAEMGMRIVEVKFGPFDREHGIPHNHHDGKPRSNYGVQKLKRYYYKCPIKGIEVGDIVVVEVGYFYGIATVTDVFKYLPYDINTPRLKYVLSRADVSRAEEFHRSEQEADARFLARSKLEDARSKVEDEITKLAKAVEVSPDRLRRVIQALREQD